MRSRPVIGGFIENPKVLEQGVMLGVEVITPPREVFLKVGVILRQILKEERIIKHKVRHGGIK
ncbi:hypothetical protein D3C73_1484940 [compost metagenome]